MFLFNQTSFQKLAGNLGLDIELSIYPVDLEKILEKTKKTAGQ
jgi:hypothetical protein